MRWSGGTCVAPAAAGTAFTRRQGFRRWRAFVREWCSVDLIDRAHLYQTLSSKRRSFTSWCVAYPTKAMLLRPALVAATNSRRKFLPMKCRNQTVQIQHASLRRAHQFSLLRFSFALASICSRTTGSQYHLLYAS